MSLVPFLAACEQQAFLEREKGGRGGGGRGEGEGKRKRKRGGGRLCYTTLSHMSGQMLIYDTEF